MPTPHIVVRGGHPDFLDLPWEQSLAEWKHPRRLLLPKGISRHEVHFYGYETGTYAIKELPLRPARHEYAILRELEDMHAPAVKPVGLVERPWLDPHAESAAAVITRYLDYGFSYRELLSGPGFGERRNQMLNAFAELLVEMHLLGCYWGDCSLSNVLYRYDANAIEVTMVDAETSEIHPSLTDGQRESDIEIMITNVAGGMSDIAASHGIDLDKADIALGEDITARYRTLWNEVNEAPLVGPDERYLITERINRLNGLGFEVADVELVPEADGHRLRIQLKVAGRNYHSHRLRELTGVDAAENQARQILSDLHYFEASRDTQTATQKPVTAVRWRVEVFEPFLARLQALKDRRTDDPVQAYTDFLHHRYLMSTDSGRDVPNEEAYARWLAAGQPGYPTT
jgi:hypothetical protein